MAASSSGTATFGFKLTPGHKLKLSDCTCPICMCISIEPVTMPCGHELCRRCFQQNVQEASLSCPMCRTRISTWTRKATRDNKLVNEKRWKEIREAFPDKVQKRLEGNDDACSSDEEEDAIPQQYFQLVEEGAIRREYEEQLKHLEEERLRIVQEEEEQSRRLIAQLEEEEQQKLIESRKRDVEDEILARQLSDKLKQANLDFQSPEVRKFLEKKERQLRSSSSTALEKFLKKTQRNADGTLPEEANPFSCFSPSEKAQKYAESPVSFRDAEVFLAQRESSLSNSERCSMDYMYTNSGNVSAMDESTLGLGIDIKLDIGSTPVSRRSEQSSVIILGSSPQYGSLTSTPVSSVKRKTKLDQWLCSGSKSSTPAPRYFTISSESNSRSSPPPKALNFKMEPLFSISDYKSPPKCSSSSTSLLKSSGAETKSSTTTSSPDSKTPPPPPPPPQKSTADPCKTPPNLSRTTSGDSLGQEMVHFRPIDASPRTPPKRLPGGRVHDPPIVRSTPVNLTFSPTAKNPTLAAGPEIPQTSMVMKRSLRLLAAQRQAHVSAFSKATCTEQAYWSPKKNRVIKVHQASSSESNSTDGLAKTPAKDGKSSLPLLPLPPDEDSQDVGEDFTLPSSYFEHNTSTAYQVTAHSPTNEDETVIEKKQDGSDAEDTKNELETSSSKVLVEKIEANVDMESERFERSSDLEVTCTKESQQVSEMSVRNSQSQSVSSQATGKMYKMKRKKSMQKKKKVGLDLAVPVSGPKYNVEQWLNRCSEGIGEEEGKGGKMEEEEAGGYRVDEEGKADSGEVNCENIVSKSDEVNVETKDGKPDVGGSGKSDAKEHDTENKEDVKKEEHISENSIAKSEEILEEDCKSVNTDDVFEEPAKFTKKHKRKRKEDVSDAESCISTISTRSKSAKSVGRKTTSRGKKGKKLVKTVKTDFNENSISKGRKRTLHNCYDAEKENSVDSYDSNLNISQSSKLTQDTIKLSSESRKSGKSSKATGARRKRESANLDFTSGSPRKKLCVVKREFDVEYSPTPMGKKLMTSKKGGGFQSKLQFRALPKGEEEMGAKKARSAGSDGELSDVKDELSDELQEELKGLHAERLKQTDFESEFDYRDYIEEQDRLLALKLQADFDFEARFHLNAVRRKGSGDEYKLRRGRKRADYRQFFSEAGCSRSTRSRRK